MCFAVFVSVITKSLLAAVPGLMGYNIIRASQEYEGAAWTAYDIAFRRQAGQRDRLSNNSSLYTICFTGKARRSQRCNNCLSVAPKSSECYCMAVSVHKLWLMAHHLGIITTRKFQLKIYLVLKTAFRNFANILHIHY